MTTTTTPARRHVTDQDIALAWRTGLTVAEISQHGVTRQRVRRVLADAGLLPAGDLRGSNQASQAKLSASNLRRAATAARLRTETLAAAVNCPDPRITGEDRAAGRHALKHPGATLGQLAESHDPPLTKSQLNGRLRTLIGRHLAWQAGQPKGAGSRPASQPLPDAEVARLRRLVGLPS